MSQENQNKRPKDNRNQNENGSDKRGGRPPKQNLFFMGLATLFMLLFISYFMQSMRGSTNREITYNRFIELIEAEELEEVSIESDRVVVTPKEGVVIKPEDEAGNEEEKPAPNPIMRNQKITYYTGKIEEDDTLTARLLEKGIKVSGDVPDSTAMVVSFLMTYVMPILLMWVLLSLLFRRMNGRGGPMGVGVKRRR